MVTRLPTLQSRETHDPLTRRTISLKVFAHGPGFSSPEKVVVEIESAFGVTLRLSVSDAAWLGHTLLSAQDDAQRMAGPDYADSPAGNEKIFLGDDYPDAGDRAWSERKDASARHSVMDPRD